MKNGIDFFIAIVIFFIILLSTSDVALAQGIGELNSSEKLSLQKKMPYYCTVQSAEITTQGHLMIGCTQGILYDIFKIDDKALVACISFKDTSKYCFVTN